MANSTGVIVKYVRHKVSVARWKPVPQGSLQEPELFVTGSWDNGVSYLSAVCFIIYCWRASYTIN